MKKLLSICLAIVMLASVAALASCNLLQGNGDSYKGSASEYYYASSQEAINAYLENELSGGDSTAVYVSHTKEKDLTDKQIANLNLVEKYDRTVIGAEQIIVNYAIEEYVDDDWQTTEQNLSRTIYIIVYDDNTFRYFATPVKTGETLTVSYKNSLYNTDNYTNCTLTSSIELKMFLIDGADTSNMSMTIDQQAKFTKTAFWFDFDVEQKDTEDSKKTSMEMYVWDGDTSLMGAIKTDGEWDVSPADENGVKMSDLMQRVFDMSLDSSDACYFEKTDDGYKLKSDKAKEWFVYYYNNIGAGSSSEMEQMLAMCNNFDVSYKVTVRNGRISKISIDVSFTVTQGTQSVSLAMSASTTYTNFGITKVTVPKDVLDLAK